MSFGFYLGGIHLPVSPSALSIKYPDTLNKISLVSGDEIVLARDKGLAEISFTALLPSVRYPFAEYRNGFVRGGLIFSNLISMRNSGKPFHFVVLRLLPGKGIPLVATNIKAVFSQLTSREDATQGSDIYADIKLCEFRDFAAKRVRVNSPESPAVSGAPSTVRPADTAPVVRVYTVVKGDSLWMISKKFLGSGNRYKEIYNLNKSMIDARNSGTGKPYYTIYPGQVLKLP